MRKLASIQRVVSVSPIKNAGKIEVAQVLGWECVIKKGELFPGDLCVYIEIDSILPKDNPAFEFMAERNYKVKTIKLRGQVSQGLALPLSILPEGTKAFEGDDVTKLLNITKRVDYIDSSISSETKKKSSPIKDFLYKFAVLRPVLMAWNKQVTNETRGAWPSWISKTDEERIQNIPFVLERFKDEKFYVTEKIDYQSATFFVKTHKSFGRFSRRSFGVCSRNTWKKTEDDSVFWQIARKYNLEEILMSYDQDLTIQGEQGGPGIQGNKYKLKEPDFWVFNIIDNKTNRHFSLNEMESFCQIHGLKFVPVIDREFKLKPTVKEMVELSRGKSNVYSRIQREGVVVRLIKDGSKVCSFKVINPDFLLKYDDQEEEGSEQE